MKRRLLIRSTVYPLGYDKNANSFRGPAFTQNFNNWAKEISEATKSVALIMDARLNEAKELLGILTQKH
jgi:hypothetical protein